MSETLSGNEKNIFYKISICEQKLIQNLHLDFMVDELKCIQLINRVKN
jgi:hypothetical protein